MFLPFIFTLSRASYLGVVPTLLALTLFTRRRRAMAVVFAFLLLLSPLFLTNLLPHSVTERITYTFKVQAGQPTVRLGTVGFDPSTSERLHAMRDAVVGWARRPVFGYGVTGFRFMDTQYFRTLVETGIVGFVCFLWLVWSVLRSAVDSLGQLRDPEDRGFVIGFLAGTIGILVHAFGSNTFIIIRIMEPFWFFMAVVVALPMLEQQVPAAQPARAPAPAFRRMPVLPYPARRPT
jgi:hypothetical protein